jgi:hypothetical protein
MLFNSPEFIFVFLPVTLIAFFIWARIGQSLAIAWLCLASFAFYAYWKPANLPILAVSIVFNYAVGNAIIRVARPRLGGRASLARLFLAIGVAGDLALLSYFKYTDFLIAIFNQLLLQNVLPRSVVALMHSAEPIFNYRSAQDGNWRNEGWPGYRGPNPTMTNDREPDCQATSEVIAAAKKYVQRLGSGDVVLTLIPHSNSCRTKVQEIAVALGVPFLAVDWKNMTTFDGGGHLDAEGGKKFTAAVLDQLVQTRAFREAVAERASLSAPQ